MSIDEAIAHARKIADENSDCWKHCTGEKDCKTCEKENEQLAEWLEELKAYRENEIKNRTIDDFVEKLCKAFDETALNDDGYYPNNVVRSIAEQLKAGGDNE